MFVIKSDDVLILPEPEAMEAKGLSSFIMDFSPLMIKWLLFLRHFQVLCSYERN